MRVQKRNGKYEEVSFDKILRRLKCLSTEANLKIIDISELTQRVIQILYDGVSTKELDEQAARLCMGLITEHQEYGILASRIIISNHHKNTNDDFEKKINRLYNNFDKNNDLSPLIDTYVYNIMLDNIDKIKETIDYDKDLQYDYFGFKTLERAYLLSIDGEIIERPQDMLMRVSFGIYKDKVDKALSTYKSMSGLDYTHATPTLYNSGTPRSQMSSCFLIQMKDDSISGIFDTLKTCALISKYAGGIGVNFHNVRATGSLIRGTNGTSNGIIPMLKVFNDTACYVDQGGGKRNGSFAMYLEPWHGDIESFLEMKKNHGDESKRARDLFYALWIPDLFMKRVENDEIWSLFCPDVTKGLSECWGDEFEELYTKYEKEGKYIKQMNAQDLWFQILTSQIETGTPYMLYKDSCNRKSNQQNLGTIKSSNLCAEIIEYTSENEVAVCNLASISLPSCVKRYRKINKLIIYSKPGCIYCKLLKKLYRNDYEVYVHIIEDKEEREGLYLYIKQNYNKEFNTMPLVFADQEFIGGYSDLEEYIRPGFDFEKLGRISEELTENLNHVIDNNYYPVKEAAVSNYRHRPIGIGVQGLADTFLKMYLPFSCDKSKEINKRIFETIYYHSLKKSCELAKKRKNLIENTNIINCIDNPVSENYISTNVTYKEKLINEGFYESYMDNGGCPIQKGIYQYDMWDVKRSEILDWKTLHEEIKKYGIRNSLLLSPMPTASTSQILGNNECIEPWTSNIYNRRTLAGEFMIINKNLIEDLQYCDLWSIDMKNEIIKNNGSIQTIQKIPKEIKKLYKTVWEIKQKDIIDMAADRGAFICQSQSLNIFMENPNFKKLSSMHFYGWKKGLKCGQYYLRTRNKVSAQQFTIEPENCENCSG